MSLRSLWAHVCGRIRQVLHCWAGSFLQRRGELSRAQDHYLRAIEEGRPSFQAHLNLGRIYLRQERIGRAIEELQRAREIDPHRFAREGFPGDPLLWMAERLPEARLHKNLTVPGNTTGLATPELAPLETFDPASDVEELPFGDFTGRDEAERFALLPPIAISDVDDIDWDRLGRELSEDE